MDERIHHIGKPGHPRARASGHHRSAVNHAYPVNTDTRLYVSAEGIRQGITAYDSVLDLPFYFSRLFAHGSLFKDSSSFSVIKLTGLSLVYAVRCFETSTKDM